MSYKVIAHFDQAGARAFEPDEIIGTGDLTPEQIDRAVKNGFLVEVPVAVNKTAAKPASTVMPKGKR